MKRTWKVAVAGTALTAVMATSGALAQNGVANTSQKGSLLMYARIDVRPGFDTIVRMSNDNNQPVDVKCYYMNEAKGRRDFEFKLTKKQPAWWSVGNGYGSITVNEFPTESVIATYGNNVHSVYLGELICWAVDRTGYDSIRFNHLSGTATIYDFADSGGPTAFQYNSWNFKANAPGPVVGVPGGGELLLNGTDYDRCPAYLIGHFSPAGTTLDSAGGPIFIADNDLSVVSCNQDLRQDFAPHFTKLEMTVWNEYEVKYTGAWECSDGYHFFDLQTADAAPQIFTRNVLKTNAAMVMVEGVRSSRCLGSEDTGLVGVLSTSTFPNDGNGSSRENEIGTTLNAAGSKNGYVRWDVQPIIVPEKR